MGRVHYQVQQNFSQQNPEFDRIFAPFLAAFDVTRAFWKHRGEDRVACIYLKPEPFIAEQIGFEREVLCVYAPYPTFQARTINLHDAVFDEDRVRLDPMGSVIVADDPDTRAKVMSFVQGDPDRAPIVSLSTDDLMTWRGADDIRRVLAGQLYARDLFALESPLRSETTFFGREEIVSQLLDRFKSGQNSGLFGLRRIGKTSILYALQRRIFSSQVAGVAYLDVSSPEIYQSRWWMVLQKLIAAFAEPLGLERGDRSRIRALTIKYSEADAAGHFRADVVSLSKYVAGNRLLALIDEIEHLTFEVSPSVHWSDDFLPFWKTIRSVHQETGKLGFIVVGVNPKILEADRVGRHDNPLFSTTQAFFVPPFDYSQTREMVRRIGRFMALRFEEGLYQRLCEEYGGHPFLVRQACSILARKKTERPAMISSAEFESQRPAIAVALEKNVTQILNVLAIWYPEEYELVRYLAAGEIELFREFAQASSSFTEHVHGYGLVNDARGDPKIRIGLVRSHLARVPKRVAEAAAEDWPAIQAEISRRRNAIEERLRLFLKEGLHFAKGKRAAEAAYAALSEDRRSILAQYDYRGLWSELYFNELISIFEKNFEVFKARTGEDRPKIMAWLDQINRCRSDAHAKKLSADDLAYLRVAFRRIEELLEVA